jgi:hypothetical protein
MGKATKTRKFAEVKRCASPAALRHTAAAGVP